MEGAGVEGYRPEDWKPEETRRLDELVNQLGHNRTYQNIVLGGFLFCCACKALTVLCNPLLGLSVGRYTVR